MARKSQRQMARERFIRDEVREIFAMFRALGRSYDALPDKSGIDELLAGFVRFDGFDGNNESEHLHIAHQLASISRDIQAFDSHGQRLRGYQMMVRAWNSARDKENLTKEDILRIIRPD